MPHRFLAVMLIGKTNAFVIAMIDSAAFRTGM